MDTPWPARMVVRRCCMHACPAVINDILDVAALKEGKLTIKHELVSLSKAVSHVVDIVSPLAKKDVSAASGMCLGE